jgi:predicted ester cyclase
VAEVKTQEKPKRQTKAAVEKVAKSYFKAAAERDPDAMAGHWHPDGVDDFVPVGVFRGPDEVRALFREVFAAVPDMEMTVDRIVADGKAAAVQWRLTGTFDGAQFMGIEPNGRRIELRGIDCLEVEGGKIMRNTAIYDGAAFARAIGMLPPRDSGGERAMIAAFNTANRVRSAIRERMAR